MEKENGRTMEKVLGKSGLYGLVFGLAVSILFVNYKEIQEVGNGGIIYFDNIIRLGYQSSIELDIKNIESIRTAKEQGGIGEKTPKETYYSLLNMDSMKSI